MRVDGLELDGYTNHKGTAVRFPSRGVMVVTGTNGSGKSSLLEAVGWAGSLRRRHAANPVRLLGAVAVWQGG
jgi:DNA repair exonuclease SbcCD ATPase subunit